MTYITVKEASEKWNITPRRVCVLCSNGQIPGAVKKSKVWMIPDTVKKPEDGRKTQNANTVEPILFLFNPTYFESRNISTATPEENFICNLQDKFLQGRIVEAYADIGSLLAKPGNDRYKFVALILQAFISIDAGLKNEYIASMKTLVELSQIENMYTNEKNIFMIHKEENRESYLYELMNDEIYPELMPLVCFVNARRDINEILQNANYSGILNHEIICKELEDKQCPVLSAYYHLILAVYYNALSEKEKYYYHIKKTTDILLPRKWYTPLAEYSSTIDLKFIKEIDDEAYDKIMALSRFVIGNYVKTGLVAEMSESSKMERGLNIQIGFKIVQGKSNEEIADELGISQYKVKQHIDDLFAITGVSSKKEIKQFILENFFI